jgi:dUTPase
MRTEEIVRDACDASFRSASYDLTVGTIINPKGVVVDEYQIPPHGLVKVISTETIRMPKTRVGYVLVKTSICNQGILALNIGIVDPGYAGPLSSTLVNFGKATHRLRAGDVFSRLTVHDIANPDTASDGPTITREKAIRDAVDQVDQHLSENFLDVEATATKAADKAFASYRDLLLKWIPLAALLVAGLTFALNYGNMYGLYRVFYPQDVVRTSSLKEDIDKQMYEIEKQNSRLAARINELEKERVTQRAASPKSKAR